MSLMRQPDAEDPSIIITGDTRSSTNLSRSRIRPDFPEEILRRSPPFHDIKADQGPARPVLVQFESLSEWSRALKMIRGAEIDQDKELTPGGQSSEASIWTRLL